MRGRQGLAEALCRAAGPARAARRLTRSCHSCPGGRPERRARRP
jgi:hypothetical protein